MPGIPAESTALNATLVIPICAGAGKAAKFSCKSYLQTGSVLVRQYIHAKPLFFGGGCQTGEV